MKTIRSSGAALISSSFVLPVAVSSWSVRANAVLAECKVLDLPHAIDNVHLGLRAGADPAKDPRDRSGIGWLLLKYLSLISGTGRMNLESVVDDFLIHLLGALGYSDGDLVVL
jgi:hypothetical protein